MKRIQEIQAHLVEEEIYYQETEITFSPYHQGMKQNNQEQDLMMHAYSLDSLRKNVVNMLFSDNPGGYCSTLKLAGLDCPKIQDPRFTYGNPDAARQQSERQIENTERAIHGFEQAVPDNLGRGFVIK